MAQSSTGTGVVIEVLITDDNATNGTVYPVWASGLSGSVPLAVSSAKVAFNPASGDLTATRFVGPLLGNASTVTTNANLTGDVTSVGNATTLATVNSNVGTFQTATITVNAKGLITAASTGTPTEFTSSDQTITSGGSLTIAHGLGAVPHNVHAYLVCTTAQINIAVGDIIPIDNMTLTTSQGIQMIPDATNIVCRYGSAVNVFQALNNNTGTTANLTNANFKVRIYAKLT